MAFPKLRLVCWLWYHCICSFWRLYGKMVDPWYFHIRIHHTSKWKVPFMLGCDKQCTIHRQAEILKVLTSCQKFIGRSDSGSYIRTHNKTFSSDWPHGKRVWDPRLTISETFTCMAIPSFLFWIPIGPVLRYFFQTVIIWTKWIT